MVRHNQIIGLVVVPFIPRFVTHVFMIKKELSAKNRGARRIEIN